MRLENMFCTHTHGCVLRGADDESLVSGNYSDSLPKRAKIEATQCLLPLRDVCETITKKLSCSHVGFLQPKSNFVATRTPSDKTSIRLMRYSQSIPTCKALRSALSGNSCPFACEPCSLECDHGL